MPKSDQSNHIPAPSGLRPRRTLGIIGATILVLTGVYLVSVRAVLSDSILQILANGLGLISIGLACLTLAYGLSDLARTGPGYQRCPECYEVISAQAFRCPRCMSPIGVELKDCPECLEPIQMLATTCEWCGSDLIEKGVSQHP